MDGVTRPWRCFGEDASPCCPQDSDPQRHIFFFFLIGGSLLYNMVLVSFIHQHGSAVCVTCPPSHLPPLEVVTEPLCEVPESHSTFPRGLFYTSWCAHFHATLSTHPTLSLPSVSTSLLFMRDTRSASPWLSGVHVPRAQRRWSRNKKGK